MTDIACTTAGAPFFETALDANGVPAYLMTNRSSSSMDLKLQPNGHFSHATAIAAKGTFVFISGMTARRPDGSRR